MRRKWKSGPATGDNGVEKFPLFKVGVVLLKQCQDWSQRGVTCLFGPLCSSGQAPLEVAVEQEQRSPEEI